MSESERVVFRETELFSVRGSQPWLLGKLCGVLLSVLCSVLCGVLCS